MLNYRTVDNLTESPDPIDYRTPEKQLIDKDKFKTLSDEARLLMNVILDLPDEYFTKRGRLKKHLLRNAMKTTFNWPARKVEEVAFELGIAIIFLRN